MIVIHTLRGIARADVHRVQGRAVSHVVRWEVVVGGEEIDGRIVGGELVGDSITYPIHGDGSESRGFAWRAAFAAAEGRPPQSVMVRSSWPVVSVLVGSAA